MTSIFVEIAAYRDPECVPTIRDLLAKAARPDLIDVGVCWQALPADQDMNPRQLDDTRVCVNEVMATESRGVCWARHKAQMLWQGEEFVLQIDSHMRFVPEWDLVLMRQLQRCPSPRSVLSSFPLRYDPPDTLAPPAVIRAMPAEFLPNGLLRVSSRAIAMEQAAAAPQPTAFVSGAFVFGPCSWMLDCPYDPHLYFWGEEQTLAARLWTHGWDIFMPCEPALYHHYGKRTHHWDDNPQWGALDRLALKRACHMLGSAMTDDSAALIELDLYGLGSARSLEAFYHFSGVDYARKTIDGQSDEERKASGMMPV
jgi:hypothetical protein